MASFLTKCATISLVTLSGFTYDACYRKPDDPQKPHILFLHGFPSSAYDWRHQVEFFADAGYGIIAPDTLGYGDSGYGNHSKSLDPSDYLVKEVGGSLIEVVNNLTSNDTKVHGVGHDWGSTILSRLANYHPDRFLSYSFLAISYFPPGHIDLDAINAADEARFGHAKLGYWKFFNQSIGQSDAGPIIDSHQDSFVDLLYPRNMTYTWNNFFGPVNATQQWLQNNTRGPRADYITPEEFEIHKKIFLPQKGGYTPPLGYYRALARNLNLPDEATIQPGNNVTNLSALYIGPTVDPLVVLSDEALLLEAFSSKTSLKNVTAGHWPQLEKPHEVNSILKKFFEGQS